VAFDFTFGSFLPLSVTNLMCLYCHTLLDHRFGYSCSAASQTSAFPFKELNPLCTRTLSCQYLFWVEHSLTLSAPLDDQLDTKTFGTAVNSKINLVECRSFKHDFELPLRIKLVIRFSCWQNTSRLHNGSRAPRKQSRIGNIQLTGNSRD
jgi:hypothetical protein